jgi:hypothetical protein
MRVTTIGTGYVGLISGACFADFGHDVTCIEKDAQRTAGLNRAEIPIFEPGLADLVANNIAQERLTFSSRAEGIDQSEVMFIAVGTPSRRGGGYADLLGPRCDTGNCATAVAYRGRGHEIDRTRRNRQRGMLEITDGRAFPHEFWVLNLALCNARRQISAPMGPKLIRSFRHFVGRNLNKNERAQLIIIRLACLCRSTDLQAVEFYRLLLLWCNLNCNLRSTDWNARVFTGTRRASELARALS